LDLLIKEELFFTEEIQTKFRERFGGLRRPLQGVETRDASFEVEDDDDEIPFVCVVEAVMWYLHFFRTVDLKVKLCAQANKASIDVRLYNQEKDICQLTSSSNEATAFALIYYWYYTFFRICYESLSSYTL
jgi:hypothetical protein